MSPELSRLLAHKMSLYRDKENIDMKLYHDFSIYVTKHESDINSLDDIPKKYNSIVISKDGE